MTIAIRLLEKFYELEARIYTFFWNLQIISIHLKGIALSEWKLKICKSKAWNDR